MIRNHVHGKVYLAVFMILFIGAILMLTTSCSKKRVVQLECLSNYIYENIEKEKVENFVKLEGINVWREGWERLTSDIAENHYLIEDCSIPKYLAQYNLNLNDLEGQMFFVYSMHSYLKDNKVNPEAIRQKVDSLFFNEYNSPRK